MTENNDEITSKVAAYLSEFCSIDIDKIKSDSELVKDLHIEGDDGVELIESFSQRFNVDMTSFNTDDYFVPESGFNPFFALWQIIFGKRKILKPLHVYDLVNSVRMKEWTQ